MRIRHGLRLALFACALLAAAWSLMPTSHVSAHAAFVRADPAPDVATRAAPDRVTVWFSEGLAPALSGIEVLDSTGLRVDRGDSTGDPLDDARLSVGVQRLPNGTYTVAWHNVSTVDGHPLRGSYVFYVGERPAGAVATGTSKPATLPSPADPWARWGLFLAALTATGGLLFEFAVLGPVLPAMTAIELRRRFAAAARVEIARVVGWALTILLVYSLFHLVVQAAVVTQQPAWRVTPGALGDAVRQTTWGQQWLARWLLSAAAAVLFVGLPRVAARLPRQAGRIERARWLVPCVLLFGALLTFSLSSHAAAARTIGVTAVATDFAHLVAAAAWVGGLAALLVALLAATRTLTPAERRPLLIALIARFSILAGVSAGTLVITGLFASWLQVTSWDALATPYGGTLLVKVALVTALLALAGVNLLWVRPRLGRAEAAGQWLRRLVVGEVALVALVLLAAAFLTSLEPARQVAAREGGGGISFEQTDGGTTIRGRITPGTAGTNRVMVALLDRRGQAVTNASSVTARIRYLDVELGDTTVTALPTTDGTYEASNIPLSIAGVWQVQVLVTRPDAGDASAATRFTIGGVGAASTVTGPSVETARALWAWVLVGLGMLVLVVAPGAWRSRVARTRVRVVATTVLLTGVVLAYGAHTHRAPITPATQASVNPVLPDARSVGDGRALFQERCARCHGPLGLGDGPDAKALVPPPADLRAHIPLHGDGQVFAFISGGFPGSAMPAYAGQLTDSQMWDLVNYLRTLAQPPPRQ